MMWWQILAGFLTGTGIMLAYHVARSSVTPPPGSPPLYAARCGKPVVRTAHRVVRCRLMRTHTGECLVSAEHVVAAGYAAPPF